MEKAKAALYNKAIDGQVVVDAFRANLTISQAFSLSPEDGGGFYLALKSHVMK